MTKFISKSDRLATDRKIIAGVNKHITKNIVLGGESMSPKDVASAINQVAALEDRSSELRLELSQNSKAIAEASDNATTIIAALKRYVLAHFGEESPVLADFGFAPRKRAVKTVDEKYVAVEKSRATRAARHTMGSRQREDIHGDPATPPMPPVTAPQAPVVATAPSVTPPPPPVATPAQPQQPVITNGVNGANGTAQPALLSLNGLNGAGH